MAFVTVPLVPLVLEPDAPAEYHYRVLPQLLPFQFVLWPIKLSPVSLCLFNTLIATIR